MLSPALQQALIAECGKSSSRYPVGGGGWVHPHPVGRRDRAATAEGPPTRVELAGREKRQGEVVAARIRSGRPKIPPGWTPWARLTSRVGTIGSLVLAADFIIRATLGQPSAWGKA